MLNAASGLDRFWELARQGNENGTKLWLQLGHAGALAYVPTSRPKGPSALDLPGLCCAELTIDEVHQLPAEFARTAQIARQSGFGGVQVHAAHGFLLSQFLSPLFNKRSDEYGGEIANRMRLLLEVIDAVRADVGPSFPIAVKRNSLIHAQASSNQPNNEKPPRLIAKAATKISAASISRRKILPWIRPLQQPRPEGAIISSRYPAKCSNLAKPSHPYRIGLKSRRLKLLFFIHTQIMV